MESFKLEVISFIAEKTPHYQVENWGVMLLEPQIGIVFHYVPSQQVYNIELPKNVPIIHLWQDHWLLKKEVVKGRITSFIGISKRVFARKTKVIKLHKPELMHFLQQNHLNEPANAKFKYGLMQENELVAVAVFSASCPVHRGTEIYRSHQLIRFCNKNGITVVGGLSKLIHHFIKEQSPEDIMTYADLDWSDGKGYIKIGFEKIGELPPQKFTINEALVRNYKEVAPSNNRVYTNQGSAKYLLDLKNAS